MYVISGKLVYYSRFIIPFSLIQSASFPRAIHACAHWSAIFRTKWSFSLTKSFWIFISWLCEFDENRNSDFQSMPPSLYHWHRALFDDLTKMSDFYAKKLSFSCDRILQFQLGFQFELVTRGLFRDWFRRNHVPWKDVLTTKYSRSHYRCGIFYQPQLMTNIFV